MSDGNARRAGFSLLEALLAIAVTGAVLAAAHTVLENVLRAEDVVRTAAESLDTTTAVAWLLEQDLRGVVGTAVAPAPFAAQRVRTGGQTGRLMSFVTTANPRHGRGASGLFLVTYSLRPFGTAGLSALVRTAEKWPERPGRVAVEETVCTNVRSLELSFLSGAGWSSDWPPDMGPPRAVRFQLSREPAQGSQGPGAAVLVALPAGRQVADGEAPPGA